MGGVFNNVLILGFRRDVDEICGLLGYYAASCGNCLPTFQDNVSVTSSRVKSQQVKSPTRTLDLLTKVPYCSQAQISNILGAQKKGTQAGVAKALHLHKT